jgi:hypothetical protein
VTNTLSTPATQRGRARVPGASRASCLGLEAQPRKLLSAFVLNGLEPAWIESERPQDRRRDLSGLDGRRDGLRSETRIRHKQDDVGVVPRKAAMLGDLLLLARVDHPDIGRYDYVRSPRIAVGWKARKIEHRSNRRP